MRVLEVAASWKIKGHPGGGENYFSEFVKNLSHICDTDVIVAKNSSSIETDIRTCLGHTESSISTLECCNLSFQRVGSRLNPFPSLFGRNWSNLPHFLESGSYDVIHVHNFRTWMAATFVLKATKYYSRTKDRPPFIMTDHGALTFPFPELLIKRFDALANPTALFNRYFQEMADRNLPTLNLGAGVDHNIYHPLNVEKTCDILLVGRIADWKGLDLVVKAAYQVQKTIGRKLRIKHVGPIHDWAYFRSLKSLCSKLDVNVSFLGPRKPDDLPLIYNQSLILIYPSRERNELINKVLIRNKVSEEQFGMAALEAMSCGIPVIVSNLGGLSESVRHGIDGFVFPANDVSALSNFTINLILDDILRTKLGKQARQKTLTYFDWHEVVAKFFSFCLELGKMK